MKIAVYVEGHTELIFVRELLYKWYGYDSSLIGFRCFNLRDSTAPGHPTAYSIGGRDSANYYEIVNVGNDTGVLSKALRNAELYKNNGFERIVALRDMFSDNYHEAAYSKYKSRVICQNINRQFIQGADKQICKRGYSDYIKLCFAIMEIEAWFLGMGWYLEREDNRLTPDYIKANCNIDISEDPETTHYHPAHRLHDIYASTGGGYDKSHGEIERIMGKIDKIDVIRLLNSGKCQSFVDFMSYLIPS